MLYAALLETILKFMTQMFASANRPYPIHDVLIHCCQSPDLVFEKILYLKIHLDYSLSPASLFLHRKLTIE